MSDTPETDAEVNELKSATTYNMVWAEFARKLERERDEARETVESLTTTALTAWKSDEGRAISPGVRQFSTTHNTMKNKAAQQLGRLGGKVTSKAKSAAVRENGKKGGRPPKTATAMLIRNARGGWSLCWWKGDVIPSKTFITQEQAREFAVSKNWGVKRLPECDEV